MDFAFSSSAAALRAQQGRAQVEAGLRERVD